MPLNAMQTRKLRLKESRAALWTIQLAVDAVSDSIRQLKLLRDHVHRGHRTSLATLRMARHHCLNEEDMRRVEESVTKFARLADWPPTMRDRGRYEHFERPLSDAESRPNGGDFGAFDQYIGLQEVADLRVEAEDTTILQ